MSTNSSDSTPGKPTGPAAQDKATRAGAVGNSSAGMSRVADVPDWYAPWAKEIADLYFAGNTCLFVLHGNVNDLVFSPNVDAGNLKITNAQLNVEQFHFSDLTDFLARQLFGSWDIVISFDLGRGIQAVAGPDIKRHQAMMQFLSSQLGSPTTWTRDPDQVLDNLERLIQRNLLEDDPAKRKKIAFLFPYGQYLVPAGDHASMARGPASRLVRILSWAQNPYIKRVNMAFFLIAETLSEVHSRLVQNPHVAAIEISMPDELTRTRFVEHSLRGKGPVTENKAPLGAPSSGTDVPATAAPVSTANTSNASATPTESLSVDTISKVSNGLNLVNLNVAISSSLARGEAVDIQRFRKLKKTLIERQCSDLVTFLEPSHTLDTVVGHEAAKQRLSQDARFIALGELAAAPMGYLICGPVGTGKTFLAECYAGSIGIPCLELRNFRSKYVGETEGNLEKVLNVLRSLGPVVVIIDEADAALGNRESSGDSGTSNRVFSMIASQMGNTRYRGKIIWMLLTSRPELLPIDLKRQGRAEVHIPLFYPQTTAEITHMFRSLAKKNKIALAADSIPEVAAERNLSGADIESVLLDAKREMLASGRQELSRADLDFALETFIPSAQGLAKELQEMSAVLECTDRRFLIEKWRKYLEQPNGRTLLQQKMVEYRRLIED